MSVLKKIIALFVFVAVGLLAFRYLASHNVNPSEGQNLTYPSDVPPKSKVYVSPMPTPFLFQEMTIPYLRARGYESSLTLGEEVSRTAQYTGYLSEYYSDGLKIYGLLTKPVGEMPSGGWPAIIFVHGYIPPDRYKTLTNYASYVDYLAKSGFVVFKVDLRGHGNSEGVPSGGYYSGDYVVDILNARAALSQSGFVNSGKIGLWGHSMAGNLVLRSVVSRQDIPAAVIWAGAGYTYTDLQEYMISDTSYVAPSEDSERARKRKLLLDTYGNFDVSHWFWKRVPPTNYLDGVTTSIQLNHSVNDAVVSIEYSRNLTQILKTEGITNELNEYSGGGHNLSGSTFGEAMKATVGFFEKHLKN